jgi:hypothetical protein
MYVPTDDNRLRRRMSSRAVGVGLAAIVTAFFPVHAQAQIPRPGPAAPKPDPFVAGMSRWDANHDGILTCDEWKQYADRLFTLADKNSDGFLDAAEFRRIQQIEPIFADADMSYFDDNHDRRVSRAEFADKPSPFFARYDLNHDCRVTSQELQGKSSPPQGQGRGGHRGGGSGLGRGGGGLF